VKESLVRVSGVSFGASGVGLVQLSHRDSFLPTASSYHKALSQAQQVKATPLAPRPNLLALVRAILCSAAFSPSSLSSLISLS
jgi:hypothetical protein